MLFYIKDDSGEFVDGTEKLDDVVRNRLAKYKSAEENKIRPELEAKLTEELTESLTSSITEKVKGDFQAKFDDVEKAKAGLETTIRQKTIAAEYGFGVSAEKYLGDGTEEDMRKEAENLKKNFATAGSVEPPTKKTSGGESEVQTRNGIVVEI